MVIKLVQENHTIGFWEGKSGREDPEKKEREQSLREWCSGRSHLE